MAIPNRLISISGGAFYLKGLANAAAKAILEHEQEPRVLCGSSSGALVAAFTAVLGAKKMRDIALSFDLKSAHRYKPFNEEGNITFLAGLNVAFNSFPVKQDLVPILSKLITKDDFSKYLRDEDKTKCFILVGDVTNGVPKLYDISLLEYDAFLRVLDASCAMQGLCKPRLLDDVLTWDGGQFSHQAANDYLEKLMPNIEDVICIWSRPKDWKPKPLDNTKIGFWGGLFRMIEIDNIVKSLDDEFRIDEWCEERNFKPVHIYLPRVLKHFYDDNKDRQALLIKESEIAVDRAIK